MQKHRDGLLVGEVAGLCGLGPFLFKPLFRVRSHSSRWHPLSIKVAVKIPEHLADMLGALLPLRGLFQKSSGSNRASAVVDLQPPPQLLAVQIPKDRIPEAFFTSLQDRRHSLLTILLTSILVYTIPLMSVDPLFKRIDDAHGRVCTRFGKTRVRIPLGSLNLDKLALKKDLRGNHTPRFRSIFNKKFNIGEEFRAP